MISNNSLYPTVYVLGNGQLGRMLKYAGMPLDINVEPIGFGKTEKIHNRYDKNFINAYVTAEIERWSDTEATNILANHQNFINKDVFPILADRYSQKQLFDQLNLATSPWQLVRSKQELPILLQSLSDKLVLKRRLGGYDGRGQWILSKENLSNLDAEQNIENEVIAEAFIPFDYEISIVGARFKDGTTRFYPISKNLHQQGILRCTVANYNVNQKQQEQAEAMLNSIMQRLEYVGVMAMECFVIENKLVINEIAPRVHNSGHWTQLGCNISQFELHLRAILDIPTADIKPLMPSVMINLIGSMHNNLWLKTPYAQLHWYGKEVRVARKVGHINIAHFDPNEIINSLEFIKNLLTEDYTSGIAWVINCLGNNLIHRSNNN